MKTYHFENLDIELSQDDQGRGVYKFSGEMTEKFEFMRVEIAGEDEIIFDLEQVKSFNSCGIREWIFFINRFEGKSSLTLQKCAVSVMDQINMVPDALGVGVIESFYAPYYCENEGKPVDELIVLSEDLNILNQGKAPEKKCGSCKELLEFDAIEESYFIFVKESFSSTG